MDIADCRFYSAVKSRMINAYLPCLRYTVLNLSELLVCNTKMSVKRFGLTFLVDMADRRFYSAVKSGMINA